jgi:hypothetical protein
MQTSASHRRRNLLWCVGLLCVFPIAFVFAPLIRSEKIPLCFFRQTTGLDCPFCGLTRAFACATHGQFTAANHFNPLWLPIAALMVGMALIFAIDASTGSATTLRYLRFVGSKWPWFAAVLLIFGIVRNIH